MALNVAWATDLFVLGGGFGAVAARGALTLAMGRLTGLYGALALVLQLVLIARIPWLERAVGLDSLTRWHRWTGFWMLWLLLAHVVFTTLGYAAQDNSGVVSEAGTLLLDIPDVLQAAVAMVLLVLVAGTSVRAARRRLRYETWHFAHLYAYLAVVLGFLHQVGTGRDFTSSPVARFYWWALYGTAGTAVLAFRFALPLIRNARHRLRVVAVHPEGPGVVSVYIGGRDLARLRARAGQFFLWRFLSRGQWWQAHPYSLSAAPDGRILRITVKALGDGSAALAGLRPGTRVLAEGPYGAFTSSRRTRRGVLLVAGGVGITPVRALLEEFARTRTDIVVVYRVRDERDAVLLSELRQLAHWSRARLHVVSGPSAVPGRHGPPLGARHLAALVPGIRHRDAFVCGPPGMTAAVLAALTELGVPPAQCHTERFVFTG